MILTSCLSSKSFRDLLSISSEKHPKGSSSKNQVALIQFWRYSQTLLTLTHCTYRKMEIRRERESTCSIRMKCILKALRTYTRGDQCESFAMFFIKSHYGDVTASSLNLKNFPLHATFAISFSKIHSCSHRNSPLGTPKSTVTRHGYEKATFSGVHEGE